MIARQHAVSFTESMLAEAQSLGFDTSQWIVDHICYRVASVAEYEEVTAQILASKTHELHGTLLSDDEVAGRPISTFRLLEPLKIRERNLLVEALEIPAPKSGRSYSTGFEHIEVVITESFDDFRERYRHLNFKESRSNFLNPELSVTLTQGVIKFHHLPLSCIIALEKHPVVCKALQETQILQILASWMPLISGSIPIGVDLSDSDLDILLASQDLEAASIAMSTALSKVGAVQWHTAVSRQGDCMVGRLASAGVVFELFLSTTPVWEQDSHRHLLTEYKLIVRHGESLRQQVKAAKQLGRTTEEAFVKVLNLAGDPYQVLLERKFR